METKIKQTLQKKTKASHKKRTLAPQVLTTMDFKLNQSALIEASAGTGKTYTITNLVLRILLGSGTTKTRLPRPLLLDDLLIVTFTNAATADLRKRIFERIREARLYFSRLLELIELKQQEQKESEISKESVAEILATVIPENDEVIMDLALQLLDARTLKASISILTCAERSIDNAAICTIHSFCNRALNQVYAFEAGECFNVAVTNDLSEEEKEAFYTVWRRLFYRDSASYELLELLEQNEPLLLKQELAILNRVRLSNPTQAVLGYQLENFDTAGLRLKSQSDIEALLLKAFKRYKVQKQTVLAPSLRALKSFMDKLPYTELLNCFNVETEECGPYFKQTGSGKKFTKGPTTFLRSLSHCYQIVADLEERVPQELELILGSDEPITKEKDPLYKTLVQIRQQQPELCTALQEEFHTLAKAEPFVCLGRKTTKYTQPEIAAQYENLIIEQGAHLSSELSQAQHINTTYQTLIRTLFLVLVNQQIDRQCQEHHLMGTDEVLRRLDFALNGRDKEAGERLAQMIRARYPLAMIDEFQDTDPIQYNIFSKLYLNKEAMEQGCYCYLIGDPKQSIYAFRGSDINSYLKARESIKKLTAHKGIYTLNTNYRSAADIVHGYNALFSTDLNEQNTNPFQEKNIQFTQVKADKENKPDEDRFCIEDFSSYLDGVPAHKSTSSLQEQVRGNTYVVNLKEHYSTKSQMTEDIAKATATLVAKVIKHGKIFSADGTVRAIRPGDITILVRTGTENDAIQKALWDINRPSVYFSDKSSVLVSVEDNKTEMSRESREMLYLLEAMSDCTSRTKVMRVLSSSLLSLTTEQFLDRLQEINFEKEVQCLRDSFSIWQKVGFQSAFEHWADDPLHTVSDRLLQQKSGERALTNFRHLSEIIQTAHQEQSGIQAQIHWFYDLVSESKSLANVDDAQKRLESEQDQVKIMTIHKSKGLEFPIVFMPFLWSWQRERDSLSSFFNAILYYSPKKKHKVLDFKPLHETESHLTPVQLAQAEDTREQARLLYVALTRARYANFIFCGEQKVNAAMRPSALVSMMKQDPAEEVEVTKIRFIEAVRAQQQYFSLIDGSTCVEIFESLRRQVVTEDENIPLSAEEQLFHARDKLEQAIEAKLASTEGELAPAVSFVYKDAIDRNFNIVSYSSLTHGAELNDPEEIDDDTFESLLIENIGRQGIMKATPAHKSLTNVYDPQPEKREPLEEPKDLFINNGQPCALSWFMQRLWESDLVYSSALVDDISKVGYRCEPLCQSFPRGTKPGTFLHDCLEHLNFANVKYESYRKTLQDRLFKTVERSALFQSFARQLHMDMEALKIGLVDWFNDIIEAPIVHGRHHCLALADLRSKNWHCELEFTLPNDHINTQELDQICQDVATDLLPEDMQHIIPHLRLTPARVQGFITGSIDLACRFDMNMNIDILNRFDLKALLPAEFIRRVESIDPMLDQNYFQAKLAEIKDNFKQKHFASVAERQIAYTYMVQELEELRAYRRELLGLERDEIDLQGPDMKYFVIDYKSNDLGTEPDSYEPHQLLEAIYQHRYDVQFLLYTLALYRLLKFRMAVPEDASYEELEDFYEEHIGGVAYLFLRGMKADYMRSHISPGVFFTHLDFSYIYRLDKSLQA